MPKSTPEQTFAKIFNLANDEAASEQDLKNAESKIAAWFRRHGKTKRDIQAILVKAAADDLAANPPPPPSDPRDGAPHPFDDPQFSPAGLVEGIVGKYVTMSEHVRVIYALYICFTHVFLKFMIAPRIALISDRPDAGKTTALDVAGSLVFRPNEEALGTGASIREFLSEGPGTVLLDELDEVDADAQRALRKIWNIGHKRGKKISLMVKGVRTLVNVHAPMMVAGVGGGFLAPTQKSRTLVLEMEPYGDETKPEREYDDSDLGDLDAVYSFLRSWSQRVELNPKPPMPAGMIRRFADNVKGLLSIADSCGPEWGRRAREAVTWLFEKEKAEHPEVLILHHALVIIDTLELDPIPSRVVNRELLRLDLPEARWNRYRGPGGGEYAHALTLDEQAKLLRKSGIASKLLRPSGGGKPFRGYRHEWFVEALRKYEPASAGPRLRLITPQSE
jgi:hypothetical protein